MDIEKLISDANEISNEVEKIKINLHKQREGTHKNFNFLEAIVHDKTHIEKYHSNFIAYLLNPEASHDFGTFFLEMFIKELSNKYPLNSDLKSGNILVEIEKYTTEGRRIDIWLDSDDWIIFIENKIYSGEGHDQMKDYCDFANQKKKKNGGAKEWIGVFLTLNGDAPNSDLSQYKGKTINLSYQSVICWLNSCIKDEDIQMPLHISSALQQYINVIKNILGIMKEDTKAILDYLKKNAAKTAKIISYQKILNEAIEILVNDFKDKLDQESHKINLKFETEKLIFGEPGSVLSFMKPSWGPFQIGFFFEKDGGEWGDFNYGIIIANNTVSKEDRLKIRDAFGNDGFDGENPWSNWHKPFYSDKNWDEESFQKFANGDLANEIMEKVKDMSGKLDGLPLLGLLK